MQGMLATRDTAELRGPVAPGLGVKQRVGASDQTAARHIPANKEPPSPTVEAPAAPEQHSSGSKLKYAAVYSSLHGEGEGYDAYLPSGPCVIGVGHDLASTKQNLQEGLKLWVEDAVKFGSRIPDSDNSLEPYRTDQGPEVVQVDWVEVEVRIPGCP